MAEQPVRRKSMRAAVADAAPWKPAPYEIADAYAIQALLRGEADAVMQQRALKWIIEVACDTYGMSFRPGAEEGRRDTDFAEGRRFVGTQIVKMTRLNTAVLARRKDNVA